MTDELERAFDFLAAGDMGGTRRASSRLGVAVFDDALPLRHDSNYLLVQADDATARDLEAEARRFDRHAILLRDAELGERLAPEVAARGWLVHRGLVMAHRREPEHHVDTEHVDEVDEAALRPPRRDRLADEPWTTPELIEQLLDAKRAIAANVQVRFFAVHVDGRPVSWTDLYLDGRTAQVEDVATIPEHRRRGYASAVVTYAVETARAHGCDLVFLVTDAEADAQRLYERLGFDEIGRYVKFFRPIL